MNVQIKVSTLVCCQLCTVFVGSSYRCAAFFLAVFFVSSLAAGPLSQPFSPPLVCVCVCVCTPPALSARGIIASSPLDTKTAPVPPVITASTSWCFTSMQRCMGPGVSYVHTINHQCLYACIIVRLAYRYTCIRTYLHNKTRQSYSLTQPHKHAERRERVHAIHSRAKTRVAPAARHPGRLILLHISWPLTLRKTCSFTHANTYTHTRRTQTLYICIQLTHHTSGLKFGRENGSLAHRHLCAPSRPRA
jgi:hypothetical protein